MGKDPICCVTSFDYQYDGLFFTGRSFYSGMYSTKVNLDVFLKGHAGDSIRINRIGRPSESIQSPTLTMLLAVQPMVLSGLMQNNTFRGRGLTARFLYAMPISHIGNRRYRTDPIPMTAKEQYYSLINNLLAFSIVKKSSTISTFKTIIEIIRIKNAIPNKKITKCLSGIFLAK